MWREDVEEEAEEGEVEGRDAAIIFYRRKRVVRRAYRSFLQVLRKNLEDAKEEYAKTKHDLEYMKTLAHEVALVTRALSDQRFIVERDAGVKLIVGCLSHVNVEKITAGTRVVLDPESSLITRILPPQVDRHINKMLQDPGNVSYAEIGGLSKQIRELKECIELPLKNPEIFSTIGIKTPKSVLLHGPPGTGKTLLARAIASNNADAKFLKVEFTAIVGKYLGKGAELIRQLFKYARDHQPCIIFMDEIDAIAARRLSDATVADREISRSLLELVNQLDGFKELDQVKIIMATNRPDVLDPAFLRPGRVDRKIEIPLPNEQSRMDILKIHAAGVAKHGEIDYEAVVKLAEGFHGADLRNVCTEAGMFAIRGDRDYVIHEDFMKAVRKLSETKRMEPNAHYNADFGRDWV